MRGIVQPGAVEVARLAGDQGFEGGQRMALAVGLVGIEGRTVEFSDLVAFDEAEEGAEGRLGIGTTSPAVPLDVVGSTSYTMVDNRYAGNSGTWNGNTWTSSDATGYGGVELYSMDGIGNISPDKNVVARVGIRADGWIVTAKGFAAYSDRRIKRDAQVSPSAKDLAAIEKLKVTNYRMVDPEGGDISWHKGFIAQEVEKVMLERGITNHETAADYHRWMKEAAAPTASIRPAAGSSAIRRAN